jgi:hypothetical protein
MLTKTGGFFIKAEPRQAEIYINGRLEKKTDFFFNSVLVKNLLPKKYKIEIKKEGFFTWEKTLEIEEKNVIEIKSVILFPKNPNFAILPENQINPFLKKEATTTVPEGILAYQIINNNIYYLNATGSIFLTDSSFLTNKKLNQISFLVEPGSKYNLKISPDGKKIAYISDHEIWLLFTQDISDQPQKKAGQILFLTRFSEIINNVFWLNSDYLIFSTGDKIKISEIDNRDKINICEIGEFADPIIKFTLADKKLYILSDGKIYFSTDLLP